LKKSAGEVLEHMPANEAIGSLPMGVGLRWLLEFNTFRGSNGNTSREQRSHRNPRRAETRGCKEQGRKNGVTIKETFRGEKKRRKSGTKVGGEQEQRGKLLTFQPSSQPATPCYWAEETASVEGTASPAISLLSALGCHASAFSVVSVEWTRNGKRQQQKRRHETTGSRYKANERRQKAGSSRQQT
jgi:hypothetical protein